jgi:hypothetical protein
VSVVLLVGLESLYWPSSSFLSSFFLPCEELAERQAEELEQGLPGEVEQLLLRQGLAEHCLSLL